MELAVEKVINERIVVEFRNTEIVGDSESV